MTVTTTYNESDYNAFLLGSLGAIHDGVVERLAAIGQQAVEACVENGNYANRTWALRSSIGFGVCERGALLREGGFRVFGDGAAGAAEGRQSLARLAAGTSELTLYLVAGRHYARYVADKGFDVLDSGVTIMERLIKELGRE